ncbi:Uncharacterised protein [Mycobacterium tuberculosis]|nr:Uncharacterised protein [Mycobacterium tuberculosis]CNU94037.1 Uncharacterised protein [Mycobacterium tuberculosis]COX65004.1 Uncharacterised protein [Mycobacterium tuberculosis]
MSGRPGIGMSGNFGGQRPSMMSGRLGNPGRPGNFGKVVNISISLPRIPLRLVAFISVIIVR